MRKLIAIFIVLFPFIVCCGGAIERGPDEAPSGGKPDVSEVPLPPPVVDGEPTPPEAKEPSSGFEAKFCEPLFSAGDGFQGCCAVKGVFHMTSTPTPGMLIKGDGLSNPGSCCNGRVYYLASNGKRYVFPLAAHLVSWYGQPDGDGVPIMDPAVCGQVLQVYDWQLASIPIGGIVTYRPGTFITGIASDPAPRDARSTLSA